MAQLRQNDKTNFNGTEKRLFGVESQGQDLLAHKAAC
jgi:hypothetical protein